MAEATKVPVNTVKGKPAQPAELRPFADLRRQVERLFDDFQWASWPAFGRSTADIAPFWRGEVAWGKDLAVDVTEQDGGYEITAELPGLETKDVAVTLADGVLTIKGEKREEKEEKTKDFYVSERRYGSFQRAFRLPDGIDADKIGADFKNGVLSVKLPKTAEAKQSEKTITVKAA